MAGMSLENQFMAKDHSAEILELQQKAPQEGRGFLLRFPPFQLFLKGSKEEYTIISKHAADVQQRVQQGVVFTAALLVWDFPVVLLLQILSKGLALHKNLSWCQNTSLLKSCFFTESADHGQTHNTTRCCLNYR